MKFTASMHGAEFEDDVEEKKKSAMLFKDPAEYADMTEEEKEELTKKMMANIGNQITALQHNPG